MKEIDGWPARLDRICDLLIGRPQKANLQACSVWTPQLPRQNLTRDLGVLVLHHVAEHRIIFRSDIGTDTPDPIDEPPEARKKFALPLYRRKSLVQKLLWKEEWHPTLRRPHREPRPRDVSWRSGTGTWGHRRQWWQESIRRRLAADLKLAESEESRLQAEGKSWIQVV